MSCTLRARVTRGSLKPHGKLATAASVGKEVLGDATYDPPNRFTACASAASANGRARNWATRASKTSSGAGCSRE
jgi:hypothetical protein